MTTVYTDADMQRILRDQSFDESTLNLITERFRVLSMKAEESRSLQDQIIELSTQVSVLKGGLEVIVDHDEHIDERNTMHESLVEIAKTHLQWYKENAAHSAGKSRSGVFSRLRDY